jgi:hypothetical protein
MNKTLVGKIVQFMPHFPTSDGFFKLDANVAGNGK